MCRRGRTWKLTHTQTHNLVRSCQKRQQSQAKPDTVHSQSKLFIQRRAFSASTVTAVISFIHVAFRTHHCLLQKGDFFEFSSFKPNKTTHMHCQAFIPISRLPHTCNFIHAMMLKSKYFQRISARLQGESRSQEQILQIPLVCKILFRCYYVLK